MGRLLCKRSTPGKASVTADSLAMIIKYSYVTAISSRDLSQKGIQTWILAFLIILCQYWFICLTLNSKVKAIFNINVLIMDIFWTTCCSEQFNLLIQTNSKLIKDWKVNFWGETITKSAFVSEGKTSFNHTVLWYCRSNRFVIFYYFKMCKVLKKTITANNF